MPSYNDVKPPRSEIWPGQPVSSEVMLKTLQECEALLDDSAANLFYLSGTPCMEGCERYDNILRIIFNIRGDCTMISAYDGEIAERLIPAGSIVVGGNCNWNSSCKSISQYEHFSYSVIFSRSLTRLVYTKFIEEEQQSASFYCHYPPAEGILSALLDCTDKVISDRNRPRNDRVKMLLKTIIGQFKLDVNSQDDHRELPDNVAKAVHYIELNYFLPINCSGVADALQINRTMLSDEFHRATGETMKEFIQKLRLEKACWLLKNQNLKISEVARECGFADTGYFIKVFRRKFGDSPRHSRKSQSS